MTIRDILQRIEAFAPLALAMNWDNCGMLVGDPNAEVSKAFVCLDVTAGAVDLAIASGAQLIVSHHPLIFRPLPRISDPVLLRIIERKLAVISLHTNLDVAPGGVNHALAAKLGLEVIEHLSPETGDSWNHLSVTVPVDYADRLKKAVFEAGAGLIGTYDNCATLHPVNGSFRALPGSDPFLKGEGVQSVEELELEFMVDGSRLNAVLKAVESTHPYQTPAIYHFPVGNSNPAYGLGLVCKAAPDMDMIAVKELCVKRLGCPNPRLWTAGKDADQPVSRIAVCGGSGGSLISAAAAKADIYISGDFSYHSLMDSRIPLIDAGHFYTEYPVLEVLAKRLRDMGLGSDTMPMADCEWVRENL